MTNCRALSIGFRDLSRFTFVIFAVCFLNNIVYCISALRSKYQCAVLSWQQLATDTACMSRVTSRTSSGIAAKTDTIVGIDTEIMFWQPLGQAGENCLSDQEPEGALIRQLDPGYR